MLHYCQQHQPCFMVKLLSDVTFGNHSNKATVHWAAADVDITL